MSSKRRIVVPDHIYQTTKQERNDGGDSFAGIHFLVVMDGRLPTSESTCPLVIGIE